MKDTTYEIYVETTDTSSNNPTNPKLIAAGLAMAAAVVTSGPRIRAWVEDRRIEADRRALNRKYAGRVYWTAQKMS